jgi:hypothetical protein
VTVYVPAEKVTFEKAKLAVEAPSSKRFSVMVVVGLPPAGATVEGELGGKLAGQLPAEQALTARAATWAGTNGGEGEVNERYV